MSRTRAHVFISGKVQGVFFRATAQERAKKLGVDGWVKNLEDGRVEAVIEGEEDDVESMIEWCHKGSRRARVTDVDAEYEPPEGLESFDIRR